MNTRVSAAGDEPSGDADYMGIIFGTPRDGTTTARGGPAFTPLMRLRKSALRDAIVAAAHTVGRVGRAGSRHAITEQAERSSEQQ